MKAKKSIPIWAWIVIIVIILITLFYFLNFLNKIDKYTYCVHYALDIHKECMFISYKIDGNTYIKIEDFQSDFDRCFTGIEHIINRCEEEYGIKNKNG